MEFIWGILLLVVLIGAYVGFSLWNERTEPPEGCELPEGFSGCGGCHSSSCLSRKKPEKEIKHDQ